VRVGPSSRRPLPVSLARWQPNEGRRDVGPTLPQSPMIGSPAFPSLRGKLVSRSLVGMARRAVRLLSTDASARHPYHRGLGSSVFLASSFSLGDTSGCLTVEAASCRLGRSGKRQDAASAKVSDQPRSPGDRHGCKKYADRPASSLLLSGKTVLNSAGGGAEPSRSSGSPPEAPMSRVRGWS